MAFEQDIGGAPPARAGMSPWLKLGIGCGVFLLLIIVVCIGLGIFAGMKLAKFGEQITKQMQEIEGAQGTEVGALLTQARQANAFTEPAVPGTTAERVEVFLRIRDSALLKAKPLEQDLAGLEDLDKSQDPSAAEVLKVLETVFGLFEKWADVRKEFATALVQEGMSEEEYAYHFRLLYLSGIVEMEAPAYLEEFEVDLSGIEGVPPEMQALVQGYADRLRQAPVTSADSFILGEGAEEFGKARGVKEY